MSPELAATAGQWEYVCCYCVVRFGTSGTTSSGPDCDACGNYNLRFVHVIESNKDHRQILVGRDCAMTLTDSGIPDLAENETKRKEGWRIHYRKPGRCVTTVEDLIEKGKL